MFRFTADSPRQLASVSFSTSGPRSKIIGLYEISPFVRDIELDTRADEPYTFYVETEAPSGLPSAILPEVRITPRLLFAEVSAEGQTDANACWLASLAWWSSSMRDRRTQTQLSLMTRFAGAWNSDGTINIDKFEEGIRNSADLRMTTKRINPAALKDHLGFWPMVIGFRAPGGFGHMNVLYGYGSGAKVKAMEPWFPDPGPNGVEVIDGMPVTLDPNFKFTGQLVEREAGYWGKPAPGQSQLILAYPQEYVDKI